jgi:hypothetical protein
MGPVTQGISRITKWKDTAQKLFRMVQFTKASFWTTNVKVSGKKNPQRVKFTPVNSTSESAKDKASKFHKNPYFYPFFLRLLQTCGQIYEGNFLSNQVSGFGILTFPDGRKYTGQFL